VTVYHHSRPAPDATKQSSRRHHCAIVHTLFSTFAAQHTPPRYGLTTNIHTFNPVRIAIHGWATLFHDVLQPLPLRVRLAHVFGAPGAFAEERQQSAA